MVASKVIITVTDTSKSPASNWMLSSLNFGVQLLKTPSGLLKLLETIVGAICFALLLSNSTLTLTESYEEFAVFHLTVVAFLITTFLLLVSSLISHSTSSLLQKSVFELLYHSVAFLLYGAGSITLLNHVSKYAGIQEDDEDFVEEYNAILSMGILGLCNVFLYLLSAYYNYRLWKLS